MHAFKDNAWWPSSCASTMEEGSQWWAADFAGGERTVTQVKVTYAFKESKKMKGAIITVGDAVCGVISNEPVLNGRGKDLSVYGSTVECTEPVTGSSVTITQENGMGLALCDITVFKGDRIPLVLPEVYG